MKYRALIVAFLAFCLSILTACSEGPASANPAKLTYDDILGTGIANKCPELQETTRGAIPIDPSQSYTLSELCLQPTSYQVKEESSSKRLEAEFVPGKLMTRYTTTIAQVQGDLKPQADGSLTFFEKDGFDYQAITVQLPGGERVPFLFSIKGLVASSKPDTSSITTSTDFSGEFKVPSYRTSNFLDPKGRGLATGYDNAVALPSHADSEELTRSNSKRFETTKGKISLQVAQVDSNTGEIAGTFLSEQPSDTDLGAKEALEVKISGTFYARIQPAQS